MPQRTVPFDLLRHEEVLLRLFRCMTADEQGELLRMAESQPLLAGAASIHTTVCRTPTIGSVKSLRKSWTTD